MAFHPFQSFRKRQKTLLAILTIFVMFIFILSYGKGDAFEWLMSKIGVGRGRKDKAEVTTLYNKTVTVGDLQELFQNRRLADEFMRRATASIYVNPLRLMQGQPLPGLDDLQQVRVAGLWREADFDFIRYFRGEPDFVDFARFRRGLFKFKAELAKDNKPDAAKAVQHIINGTAPMTYRGSTYFGGSLDTDDLLDFMIWRQQADRLGIVLTDADLKDRVNHEADKDVLTGDPRADQPKVSDLFQFSFSGITADKVYDALRDEFRVRMAREAILGHTPGLRGEVTAGPGSNAVAAGSTPEQFWEFYKDRRTELRVAFLAVPVSKFTDQVKEEPSEQDLKTLYERYKDSEASPERDRPGFKVPRRIKVEFVTADANAPYYRQEAKKALQVLADVHSVTIPLMGAGSPGGVPGAAVPLALGLAAAVPPPIGIAPRDIPLQAEYEAYVKGVRSWEDTYHLDTESPYPSGLSSHAGVASLAGQMAGVGGPTDLLSVSVAFRRAEVERRHQTDQAARVASVLLAGAQPNFCDVATQQAWFLNVPVQPLPAVRNQLEARGWQRLGTDLARGALDTFTKELDKKRFNAKEADEYVQANADEKHGITGHGVMSEARNTFDLANDPALAPLRQARYGLVPLKPAEERDFAEGFFRANQVYHPEPFRQGGLAAEPYHWWLAANEKPYVPPFAEARPKVEAAWKFNKARALARKEAEAIAASVGARPQGIEPGTFLRDEAAKRGYADPYEPVEAIAKLVKRKPVSGFNPSAPIQYRPYQFEESKIASARPDMVDELFRALKKPGDAVVVSDRPDRTYYVAVLRSPPGPQEEEMLKHFLNAYKQADPGARLEVDTLWSLFQGEREEQYRAALIKKFREEAVPPDKLDEGSYKIDPELRKRIGSGRRGEGED